MTDISVYSFTEVAEDFSWLLSYTAEAAYIPSDTLDVSLFDAATHYPNGFLASGLILARKTAGGLLGPYLGGATDGRQTAVGILRASVQVVNPNGTNRAKMGCAVLKAFAAVSISHMPVTSASAPLGGFQDAAAKTALPLIYWAA